MILVHREDAIVHANIGRSVQPETNVRAAGYPQEIHGYPAVDIGYPASHLQS